jgi:hypothetical protein
MAEFSWTDRLMKVALGPGLLCGWWYFAPNYSTFFSTPLGHLTVGDIAWHVGFGTDAIDSPIDWPGDESPGSTAANTSA